PFTSIANANDSDDDEDTQPIPPVLLFRVENDARYHDGGDDDEPPFDAPYRAACAGMPAGLYTAAADPRSKDVAEGGGVLALPFRVGGSGRARRSDRSRFDSAAAVFQLGLVLRA
ncbi:uncharacterized protein LTHEOB_11301, partial [Lasiodiplodia theobromae]|uniref:uncharacterized protein n=1 Tax=Lasiodiplodia theobromae TaxID=45133 RepID=UPI0015C2DF1C